MSPIALFSSACTYTDGLPPSSSATHAQDDLLVSSSFPLILVHLLVLCERHFLVTNVEPLRLAIVLQSIVAVISKNITIPAPLLPI